jgi:eukaryotic-like serine/threonine-protein kinase
MAMVSSLTARGEARFQRRRRLGAGGMGVVYESLDIERQRLVALKALKQASPAAIARFKREFRSLANVMHPNLVALYELVAEGDEVFFTMELVRGVPFDRWVTGASSQDVSTSSEDAPATVSEVTRSLVASTDAPSASDPPSPAVRKPLDVPRLRDALRQLAEGVAALHDHGMLHRDLKPSNVLVDDTGRVVILDFGLVTDIAEESLQLDEDRPLQGTFGYMSPEQGARASLTPASDWYSLGVIMYRTLTGRLPFLGGRDDVLMDKQRFEPPAPRELQRDIPQDLDALCSELLRRRPEQRPSAQDVLRRLGSDAGRARTSMRTPASSQAAYETIAGREEELAALDAAYQAAKRGTPVLVRVSGPSGIGKSRMVRAFIDGIAETDRAMVLRGRCYEQESVPFKAIDSVIDALGDHLVRMPRLDVEGLMPRDAMALARLFPTLRQVDAFTTYNRRAIASPDPIELRRRAFGALRELLARIADRQPLVISIDDLHWGDVDSAALLAALLRPPDPPAAMVIAMYRSEGIENNAFLNALEEHAFGGQLNMRDIPVRPLEARHAHALAIAHLGNIKDAAAHAARIVDESMGNPFLVEELARYVRDRNSYGTLISLDELLRGRLQRLPAAAGRLLSIIAVAGRPLLQSFAMRAAMTDDPATLSLLKAGSFVRTRSVGDQRYVEPYHDRVRETAVQLLDAAERQQCHLRLARVHEASPSPDPETLAYHYIGAGEHARAAELTEVAAQRAVEAMAFDRAARLYGMTIQLTKGPIDRRLHVAHGHALANAGRGAEAANAFLTGLQGASSAETLDLQCRAAGQLLLSGHIDRGIDVLDQVIGGVGLRLAATPTRALMSFGLSRLRLAIRGLRYNAVDERDIPVTQLVRADVAFAAAQGLGTAVPMRAADFQARSLLLALRMGEPRRIARALAAELSFTSLRGVAVATRSAKLRAMLEDLARQLGDPDTRGLALGASGIAAFNEGKWAECADLCGRAEHVFRNECTGQRWELATSQLFQGFALALMGRVRELVARIPVLLDEANECGDLFAATSFRACLGFYEPLTRDAPDEALQIVDDAISRWSARGFHLQHANALNSRVSVDLYVGNGIRALERCRQEWPALERSLMLRVQLLRGLLWSVRARALIAATAQDGDKSRLAEAAAIAKRLDRERVGYCVSESAMLRAAIAHMRGNDDEALRLLGEAEHLALRADLVLNHHAIRRARGLVLGGDEGAALVRTADDWFRSCGLRRPEGVAAVFAPGFGSV